MQDTSTQQLVGINIDIIEDSMACDYYTLQQDEEFAYSKKQLLELDLVSPLHSIWMSWLLLFHNHLVLIMLNLLLLSDYIDKSIEVGDNDK